ncbi:MAG: hypothetical protein QNJ58_28465, partial [Desulfobacterales bacterium]|nr:hypothetical protein [Desulfobacterales bacterium]
MASSFPENEVNNSRISITWATIAVKPISKKAYTKLNFFIIRLSTKLQFAESVGHWVSVRRPGNCLSSLG